MKLVEFDASGQEMRLMAEMSQDETMLRIFKSEPPFDDGHSYTGAQLMGTTFENFLKLKADNVEEVTGPRGWRYLGKFDNLSNLYRIGFKTLRIKARVDYGFVMSLDESKRFQTVYHNAYPGVKNYWGAAIERARTLGYAETLAGRRFAIHDWSSDGYWGSGQSAINFPIQGTGGDMKELALAVMTRRHPDFKFLMDLHDGLFFLTSETDDMMDRIRAAQSTLNALPYEAAWGWTPSIPFPWDASVGDNWGEMEEV